MLEKVDNRWLAFKKDLPSKSEVFDKNYNRIKSLYYMVDKVTGYVVTALPKNQINSFVKTFNEMNFTHTIVSDKYTNSLYDKDAVTLHYITVCEYVSECGNFTIRSWTKYERNLQ